MIAAADTKPKRTRLWKPTPRDQAIYHAVAVEGRTQKEAGAEFGRSQPAVSRLLKRFERWRGGAKPEDSGDLDAVRQAHLDRWLARQRHDEIYTRAMRLAQRMEEQPAAIQRTRTDPQGQALWSEETKRDQLAAAGQMLKTALRASESLGKLADKTAAGARIEIDRERLLGILKGLRREAEEAGRVPKSGTGSAADIWLRALVGEKQGWQQWHEASDHGALFQLIDSLLASRCELEEAMNKRRAEAGKVAEDRGQAAEVEAEVGSQESGAGGLSGSTQEIADPSYGEESEPVPSTEHSVLSTGATEISGAAADTRLPTPDTPPPPLPTHQTHTRIWVGGHPPTDTSRVSLDPSPRLAGRCDPTSGCGRIVMIDPSTGKKYGEPADDYADDPLGKLYRRIEERQKREREARARAGAVEGRG